MYDFEVKSISQISYKKKKTSTEKDKKYLDHVII